jgi:DNA modification methylase
MAQTDWLEKNIPALLAEIRTKTGMTRRAVARLLDTSLVSVERWERNATTPSPAQIASIRQIHASLTLSANGHPRPPVQASRIKSRGALRNLPLFDLLRPELVLAKDCFPPLLERLTQGRYYHTEGEERLAEILRRHPCATETVEAAPETGMSAGKNTYTYDAHTYHTKVPPQGIAELLSHYLPEGGLVLDPFAGSGMTGVAAGVLGYDCILNELSPAACFIARCFTTSLDTALFRAGVDALLQELDGLRQQLYTTNCRECGKQTEILYTVWSYQVVCPVCACEFLLWDRCRSYGRTVREHKILSEFSCPTCGRKLKKSQLQRTIARPVQIGYRCCGSAQQEVTHPPDDKDLRLIEQLAEEPPLAAGFFPAVVLPEGVNLRQPAKHGLDRIDKFYTLRNLSAMSHLWKAIHRVEHSEVAAMLAFVFTSLYQRVTRLSEFRFWGGSGNTARFNVPFIFNEANVFLTFARKARSIEDHLETTASQYGGHTLVVQNSATSLDYLPADSIDLIFTDPPFGANINYSEMNLLWEAWLGAFTDNTDEAIVNRIQNKGLDEYQALMTQSLKECHRVLRPGHWLLLVFMNSSQAVWEALRTALDDAGFSIEKIDSFDKQHSTFKQFVSANTAGYDLVLHCRKQKVDTEHEPNIPPPAQQMQTSIVEFLESRDLSRFTNIFLHVARVEEVDFRKLYSEWLAQTLIQTKNVIDFATFRSIVLAYIRQKTGA